MIKVVPVASGKGGVGKSIVALNLAVSLASSGKTVILADFDLGGATQHLLLGMSLKGEQNGIGDLLHGKEKRLENLTVATHYKRLHFIPGDSMIPGTHHLSSLFKQKIISEMHDLVADYLIVDLGAGSSYTVIDMFLGSYSGLIVSNPEVTSVMAAYSFLKTAVFRMLYRLYRPHSDERALILNFASERIEGSNLSFKKLLDQLITKNVLTGEAVKTEINKLNPKLVLNMCRSRKDIEWAERLIKIVDKKLGIKLDFITTIGYDESVRASVANRQPLLMSHHEGQFGQSINKIAMTMASDQLKSRLITIPRLYDDDESLLLKPKIQY